MYNSRSACPTTPAALYAAAYIAQAPAHTLESISAELLPLAHAAGFDSLSLSQSLCSVYGARFHATGLAGETQGYAPTTLASSTQCTTLEALRESAQETLYAIAGRVGGNL